MGISCYNRKILKSLKILTIDKTSFGKHMEESCFGLFEILSSCLEGSHCHYSFSRFQLSMTFKNVLPIVELENVTD